MNNNYKQKYIKYKQKYIALQQEFIFSSMRNRINNQYGGGEHIYTNNNYSIYLENSPNGYIGGISITNNTNKSSLWITWFNGQMNFQHNGTGKTDTFNFDRSSVSDYLKIKPNSTTWILDTSKILDAKLQEFKNLSLELVKYIYGELYNNKIINENISNKIQTDVLQSKAPRYLHDFRLMLRDISLISF